jgi:hypothetical protein
MRGRGIDFEHRFNTSRWAEDLLLTSLSAHPDFLACRYGLSTVVTQGDLVYGLSAHKEPDILVFKRKNLSDPEIEILTATNDLSIVDPQLLGAKGSLSFVFRKACAAIEVEFSPYKAAEMKDRGWIPRTTEAWDKRPLKHANPPTAPNIWVKEEDLAKLVSWQEHYKVPILVAHLFDQEAFAISLDKISQFNDEVLAHPDSAKKLQMTSGIFKKLQTYDRTDAQGAKEEKVLFVVSPNIAVKVGDIRGVTVAAQIGLSSSKKYVSHIVFSGGHLTLEADFLEWISRLK